MKQFNLETQEWEEDDTPELDALGYLQSIYRDPGQPEGRRLKAAIEALPLKFNPTLRCRSSAPALSGVSADKYATLILASAGAPLKLVGVDAARRIRLAPLSSGHARRA